MRPEAAAEPSPERLRELSEELISEQSTLTLATAREGIPWAAPVYYVYLKGAFYFFSDPSSRHIQEGLRNGHAAGAVHAPSESWEGIRGVQMSGRIREVRGAGESLRAVRAYLRRFPFVKEFFPSGRVPDPKAFAERFRVRLYCFIPTEVLYLDNRIRFGYRKAVPLEP